MSIAISHNMDNVNPITNDDLVKYMGLTQTGGAGTGGTDASGSKYMEVQAGNTGLICYQYQRGGVLLNAAINVGTQSTTWTVSGGNITNQNDKRYDALCEGLKLPKTGALNTGTLTFQTASFT